MQVSGVLLFFYAFILDSIQGWDLIGHAYSFWGITFSLYIIFYDYSGSEYAVVHEIATP
jgi:hypothetical protein